MALNVNTTPIAWSIAGSDSGGGAGLQADLKTMAAFGVHGCSITTALTAQNTEGVQSIESVSEAMLRAQLQALKTDLPPEVIKIGMLGSIATCKILAEFFQSVDLPIVCDPVLKSTSGSDLLDPEALELLVHEIFPKVYILTPNLPEAAILAGKDFKSTEEAAEQILNLGVGSVLIKGGHSKGIECRDYWTDGRQSLWLSSPRIESPSTHGTGCILSSAIASAIALGQDLPDAIVTAKTFLNQSLKAPTNLGAGLGPMQINPFRNEPQDRPKVVGGIVDPARGCSPATDPGSPIPATTKHAHLRR